MTTRWHRNLVDPQAEIPKVICIVIRKTPINWKRYISLAVYRVFVRTLCEVNVQARQYGNISPVYLQNE